MNYLPTGHPGTDGRRSVPEPEPEPELSPLSRTIAVLLVAGVSLSAALLIAGLALLAATGRTGYHEAVAPAIILAREGSVAFPRTLADVWQGALALRPFAVIELGVLVLIATPVLRVAASAALFLLERDYLYTAITLTVLVLLLFSAFWVG